MTEPTDPKFEETYRAAILRAQTLSASLAGPSIFERLARLAPVAREGVLAELSTLDLCRLAYHWRTWARPKQDPDLDAVVHRVLFFLAGRGFGKSLSGAQRVRRRVLQGARSIAIIGPTFGDVEKYMVGISAGADGLLNVFPKAQRPRWVANKNRVVFHTGAIAEVNTAEEPEFRGANLDTVWADEPGKWRQLEPMWANIELATRLPGTLPLELIITGTPVPRRIFREWIADEHTVTICGSTDENGSNVDRLWLEKMRGRLGGTRLGRQELGGEILTDNPDALFSATRIEETRVVAAPKVLRVVVSVDPAQSVHHRASDATGIVVVGIDDDTGHLYALADLTMKALPDVWGKAVVTAYEQCGAVAVVVERNRGGDMVAATVRACMERRRGVAAASAIKIVEVHANKGAGKGVRAEPVSALAERGMVHLVGSFPELEQEMTEWNPALGGVSPNRLDALVWGVFHLARLGEEMGDDPRAGVRGVAAMQAAVTPQRAPQQARVGGLAALLPRGRWGSTV